jgi:hypothetical protein
MDEKISNYVLKIDNFLSKEICLNLIDNLNTKLFYRHHYNNNLTGQNTDNSINELDILKDNTISRVIDTKIPYALKRYDMKINVNYVKFSDRTKEYWTTPRFNRYSVGHRMDQHVDHIHTIFDGNRKGIPILTLLGFLNDDYDGGDLYLCNQKINTKTGDILIFPSNFLYPHRVEPVIMGIRYSWVSWVW